MIKTFNETPVSRSASSGFDLPLGSFNYFYMGRGDIPHSTNYDHNLHTMEIKTDFKRKQRKLESDQ